MLICGALILWDRNSNPLAEISNSISDAVLGQIETELGKLVKAKFACMVSVVSSENFVSIQNTKAKSRKKRNDFILEVLYFFF